MDRRISSVLRHALWLSVALGSCVAHAQPAAVPRAAAAPPAPHAGAPSSVPPSSVQPKPARAPSPAQRAFARARALLASGNSREAELAAREAERAPRLHVAALTLRGEALARRGLLDEAERAFAEAVQAAPPPAGLRARVLLGRLLMARGRVEQAEPHLNALIDAYNEDQLGEDRAAALCYVAMAARALGSVHDANDAFREAANEDPERIETQLEWAALFLDKHDHEHARESVEYALAQDAENPAALVMLARLDSKRAYDFPAVEAHLAKALELNRELPAAHVTRAAMALREMDLASADRHLDDALAIDPQDLEALSVRAAARFLADDAGGFARAKADVLQRNPRFARMYSIIAEYAEWEHRYEELVELAQEALRIDPEDATAHATLAMNLLRLGREKEGRAELDAAWQRDHFNAHVFNLLALYENVIATEYVDVAAAPFVLRMHKDERAALEPYLAPMLRKAYGVMKARYGFTPEGPLRVEMYADADHFSVRTTGLPNAAVQGVCFGKVITAVSPSGGPFNWGQITWHELAHVFHLQLSKNHVPRWFTEGLAEHETVVARPEWRREEDAALWTAFEQDRVPRLADLNRAFTQARTPDALMTAYYLSSLAVGYIVDRFGWDAMRPMLEAFGRGKRTEEVFLEVLKVPIDEVDRDLRAHLARRLQRFERDYHVDFSSYEDVPALHAAAMRAPNDAAAHAALALGLLGEGEIEPARSAATRALELDPKRNEAHFALVRIALYDRDLQAAERSLRAIRDSGQDGYVLRVLLARAALARSDFGPAIAEAEGAIAIDPDQLEAYRVLMDVGQAKGDKPLALRALQKLALLDQHDRMLQLGLLAALHDGEMYPELVQAGERALFVAPDSPDVHRRLGVGLVHTGKPREALVELDRALALQHRAPGRVQLERARALLALGKKQPARDALRAAVTADPKLQAEAEALSSK